MAYDLCSSRECNVCLLLIEKNDPKISQPESIKSSLQRCSGCQLVVYCGSEHQKQDWPLHRTLCRAVQSIVKMYSAKHPFKLQGVIQTSKDMEKAIILLKHLLRAFLDRNLNFYEEELVSFPSFCAICFSFKRPQHLCVCCRAVSYCSLEHSKLHADSHQSVCNLLQIYYCQHKVAPFIKVNVQFEETGIDVQSILNLDLIDAAYLATKIKAPIAPYSSLIDYQRFGFVADFSSVATLCYALAHVDLKMYNNAGFRIFIVGASVESRLWFDDLHTRFIFLLYPNIKCLSLYFIGPELEEENKSYIRKFLFMGTMRIVHNISYRGMFENFVAENIDQPSIIIAYNCGFSEYPYAMSHENTWYMGLQEIVLTHEVPIVFTSFTRLEADADYAEILDVVHSIKDKISIRLQRILKTMKNPYRDLRPLRNWQTSDEESFYFRNGYIQAISTSVK